MKGEEVFSLFERPVSFAEANRVLDGLGFVVQAHLRVEAVKRYGFSIPCKEAVDLIASLSPLLEIGAGSGYWSRILKAAGADVVATDIGDTYKYSKTWNQEGMEKLSAAAAVVKYPERNVFVSWPSYALPWCAEAAELVHSGRTLAYIGESRGGCTADECFFDELEKGYNEVGSLMIPKWEGIHDFLGIYVKK